MRRRLAHALFAAALCAAAALAAPAGCSDTDCHDKIAPDGGVVTSDKCTFAEMVDAGAPGNNASNNTANNDRDPGNNGGGMDAGANNDPANNDSADAGDPGNNAQPDAVDTPDGDPANNDPASNDGADATLAGDWLSQGDDIAPLLRQGGFELESVNVAFTDAGTYEGALNLASGDTYAFAGSYALDDSTSPWSIVLNQTAPQALTSQGIAEVTLEGGQEVLRYEVVQVDPPTPGFQPPTPEGGFGSTVGVEDPADNIQIYRRP